MAQFHYLHNRLVQISDNVLPWGIWVQKLETFFVKHNLGMLNMNINVPKRNLDVG